MKRISLLLVVLLYAGNMWAAVAQPPAPTRPKQAQAPNTQSTSYQECSASNQRGSEEAPFVIKMLPSQNANPPSTNQTCQQNYQPSSDWGLTIATILIAAFTGGVFIFTGFMWWTTKDAAERQLRAYIGIDEDTRPGIKQGEEKGEFIIFLAEIKNFGKTPAYEVDMRINARAFPEPLEPGFIFPEPIKQGRSTHILNPGQKSWMRLRPLKSNLPMVLAGKANFYVFGYVSYWDAFRKIQRHTHIRCKIEMPQEKTGQAHWFFCDDGNKAT